MKITPAGCSCRARKGAMRESSEIGLDSSLPLWHFLHPCFHLLVGHRPFLVPWSLAFVYAACHDKPLLLRRCPSISLFLSPSPSLLDPTLSPTERRCIRSRFRFGPAPIPVATRALIPARVARANLLQLLSASEAPQLGRHHSAQRLLPRNERALQNVTSDGRNGSD